MCGVLREVRVKKVVVSLIVGGLSISSCFGNVLVAGTYENSGPSMEEVLSNKAVSQKEFHDGRLSNEGNAAKAKKKYAAVVGATIVGGVTIGALVYYDLKTSGRLSNSVKTFFDNNNKTLAQKVKSLFDNNAKLLAQSLNRLKSTVLGNVGTLAQNSSDLESAVLENTETLAQDLGEAKSAIAENSKTLAQNLNDIKSIVLESAYVNSALEMAQTAGTYLKSKASATGGWLASSAGKGISRGASLFRRSVVVSANAGWNAGSFVNSLIEKGFYSIPSVSAKTVKGLWWGAEKVVPKVVKGTWWGIRKATSLPMRVMYWMSPTFRLGLLWGKSWFSDDAYKTYLLEKVVYNQRG